MDLMQTAAQMLADRLGLEADPDAITGALTSLLGGSDGKPDLGALLAKMMSTADLQGLAASWLGDGENAAVSPAQITAALGDGPVAAFAERLGIDTDRAASGLADVLPQLVDQSSVAGSLRADNDAADNLMGMVKGLF